MRFFIFSLLLFLPGCADLVHLPAGGNYTYTSKTTVQIFLEAFSDIIEEILLQELQGSPYLQSLSMIGTYFKHYSGINIVK